MPHFANTSHPLPQARSNRFQIVSASFALALFTLVLSACGGSGIAPGGPIPGQSTNVTLLLESTANDLFSEFETQINSIALISKSGNTVQIYDAADDAEFVHLNGNAGILANVSIPQDVYTTAIIGCQGSYFLYVTFSSAQNTTEMVTDSYGTCGPTTSLTDTITLAPPVTISGSNMVLSLSLNVAQSASYSGPPGETYSISPSWGISPVSISATPTNQENGKLIGLFGDVVSVDSAGNSFVVQSLTGSSGPGLPGGGGSFTFTTNASTVFQGATGLSAFANGMLVEMDATLQADGSLLATRVSVPDLAATSAMIGPTLIVGNGSPNGTPGTSFFILGVQQYQSPQPIIATYYLSDNTTAFQISGQFSNVQSLPFTALFDISNIVDGQNIFVGSGPMSLNGGVYTHATSVTLMPQTINGTVSSMSVNGAFQVYTVDLAPYDLIAQVDGATSVVVYIDSSARMLNSMPISVGSVERFNGIIFNDSGTLRMDCAQISEGVPE